VFEEAWDSGLWTRVGVALLCGGIVGLERQLRDKPAGIRTSSLICLGTALFVYLGVGMSGGQGDPARVLGQVVAGIGFLGAGVIMTRNGLLTGVTSAAVIWLLAAVGSAIGLGRYGAALAMAVVSVAVLAHSVDEALPAPTARKTLLRKEERTRSCFGETPSALWRSAVPPSWSTSHLAARRYTAARASPSDHVNSASQEGLLRR
jgi:putative Mg2+ transporter-C (MgtC) family protein